LEGTDPEAADLLKRGQALQRRLIAASAEAARREAELDALREENQRLQAAVSKGPDWEEMAQRLSRLKAELNDRGQKMHYARTELQHAKEKAEAQQTSISRLQNELAEAKRSYFVEKERAARQRETAAAQAGKGVQGNQSTVQQGTPRVKYIQGMSTSKVQLSPAAQAGENAGQEKGLQLLPSVQALGSPVVLGAGIASKGKF
jgi:chromosome segregation ATPase